MLDPRKLLIVLTIAGFIFTALAGPDLARVYEKASRPSFILALSSYTCVILAYIDLLYSLLKARSLTGRSVYLLILSVFLFLLSECF